LVTPAVDEIGIDRNFVASNLNRAVTLIGSNLAIFTFVLVFLYPRYASNQLNGALFQVTLTTSLLVIFLFGIAGICYFEVVAITGMDIVRRRMLVRRGDLLFAVSLMGMTALPALILFTLSITLVAIIATILWALYAVFIIEQGQRLRGITELKI
jgi:hypothetical protein